MKNALLFCALACALSFGSVAAQESPANAASVPVDASGNEAVTRTKSKPTTAGRPVVPVAVESAGLLRAVSAARAATARPEARDSTAPVPSASGAPAAAPTGPDRPTPSPPSVRK